MAVTTAHGPEVPADRHVMTNWLRSAASTARFRDNDITTDQRGAHMNPRSGEGRCHGTRPAVAEQWMTTVKVLEAIPEVNKT